jgi:hypothetical protein
MAVLKIISGGQTGADEGGLRAAVRLGIDRGGHMPLGFLTEIGSRPEFAELYGMTEHWSDLYPPRTIANVGNSDGTVRFAVDFKTKGELCTLRAINDLKKPDFKVNVKSPPSKESFLAWIDEHHIKILNVAGNRESTWSGMTEFVENYLVEALRV